MVEDLKKAGFKITAITRPESFGNSTFSPDVATTTAQYNEVDSLVKAFGGQDALIEAFNPSAATYQDTIVRAAIAAGVKHILTPDFSSDTFNPHVDEVLIFEGKRRAQTELEAVIAQSAAQVSWTALIVGGWYDWGIKNGVFWIDKANKTIMRFGSGEQKYAISRLSHISDFVVHVLRNPEGFRNRPAYFATHTVTTNQLIALVEEVGGDGWKVTDVDVSSFVERGRKLWQQDTEDGVENRVASQAWAMLGTAAIFDESNRYGGDFGTKLEKGWDEGVDTLKEELRELLI